MKKLILVLLSAALLVGCQSKSADPTGQKVIVDDGSYTRISPDELNTMLEDKDFVLINVHIPFAGNIANTDLSIPYDQIAESSYLSQLPADRNAKIVLYCRSGRMSAIAAEALVSLGYINIWDLGGGMVEWEQTGYELEK
jgi:rhodanese-related sulfurtransferase